MNEKQLAAVKSVERAMRKIERAGLAITQIDSSLVAFVVVEYEPYSRTKSPDEAINEITNIKIDCPLY